MNPKGNQHTTHKTSKLNTRGSRQYPIEGEILSELPRELPDPLQGDRRGVLEVIRHDGAVAPLEELQHGVATDVPGATSDEDVPRHGRRRRHRIDGWETEVGW